MLIFSNGKIRYKADASAKKLSINNHKKDSLKSGFLFLEFAVFHFFQNTELFQFFLLLRTGSTPKCCSMS